MNRGNGYDPKTGKFTAPKSGLYQFSFTIMSNDGSDLHMGVAKNGKYLISLQAAKIQGGTSTANPVLELKEGDSVYLIHGASATQSMAGHHYSNISGYYIGEWSVGSIIQNKYYVTSFFFCYFSITGKLYLSYLQR